MKVLKKVALWTLAIAFAISAIGIGMVAPTMLQRVESVCNPVSLSVQTIPVGVACETPVIEQVYANTAMVSYGGGHGSGVVFSRNGVTFIWTAAHVVNKHMRPDGTFPEFTITQNSRAGVARVLRAGDEKIDADCALLELVEGGLHGTAHFYRAFNQIRVGQEVIHCGYPYEPQNGPFLSIGTIAGVHRLLKVRYKLKPFFTDSVSINAYPGCSGGPLADAETGGIIGLHIISRAPGFKFIVPTREIFEWAKKHDCLWAFDRKVLLPASRVPWRGDLLNRQIEEQDTSDVDARWGGS